MSHVLRIIDLIHKNGNASWYITPYKVGHFDLYEIAFLTPRPLCPDNTIDITIANVRSARLHHQRRDRVVRKFPSGIDVTVEQLLVCLESDA